MQSNTLEVRTGLVVIPSLSFMIITLPLSSLRYSRDTKHTSGHSQTSLWLDVKIRLAM